MGYRRRTYRSYRRRRRIDYFKLGLLIAAAVGVILSIVLIIVLCFKNSGIKKERKKYADLKVGYDSLEAKVKELEARLSQKQQSEQEDDSKGKDITQPTQAPTPTLTPTPDLRPKRDYYLVCIDPGHGGDDDGAMYVKKNKVLRREATDNLAISELIKRELEALGVHVVMTRESDSTVVLSERVAVANSNQVDLCFSVHRNSFAIGKENENVFGTEIWIHNSKPENAAALATNILNALEQVGISKNRGLRSGTMEDSGIDYVMNSDTKMVSMILELGFATNTKDNNDLDKNGENYAKVIAAEIYSWLQKEIELAK